MNGPITYSALPEDLGGIEGEVIPEPAERGDGNPYPVLAPTRRSGGGRAIPTTCIETIGGDPDTALRLSFQIKVF